MGEMSNRAVVPSTSVKRLEQWENEAGVYHQRDSAVRSMSHRRTLNRVYKIHG